MTVQTATRSPCRRWSGSPTLALEALADAREEIDALNVYPVPDGDTGTNLFLTFEAAARRPARGARRPGRAASADLGRAVAAYSRGLLLGARGNSGVIMSQLVGALLPPDRPGRPRRARRRGASPRAWRRRPRPAYAAVGDAGRGHHPHRRPRGLRRGAGASAQDPSAARGTSSRRPRARPARRWSARPSSSRCSRSAGVVDAGGRGLCLVLDAAEAAFTGAQRELAARTTRPRRGRSRSPVAACRPTTSPRTARPTR